MILMYLTLRLILGLLSISIPSIAQQRSKQHPSLTRAETREAERRLSNLGYWTGAIDGLFDPGTRSASIAFQKWEGRPITGELTLDELEAMRASASPKAREIGYAHVEVDLDRQVLMIVNDEGRAVVLLGESSDGKSTLALHVEDNECATAVLRSHGFRILSQADISR